MEKDTIVWAKLGSYPYWPGRIVELSDVPKKIRIQLGPVPDDHEIVYFFGSKNYAHVASNLVMKWEDGYDSKSKNKKAGKQFLQGVKEAEHWKAHGKPMDSDDEEEDKNNESPAKSSRKEKNGKRSSSSHSEEESGEEDDNNNRRNGEKKRKDKEKSSTPGRRSSRGGKEEEKSPKKNTPDKKRSKDEDKEKRRSSSKDDEKRSTEKTERKSKEKTPKSSSSSKKKETSSSTSSDRKRKSADDEEEQSPPVSPISSSLKKTKTDVVSGDPQIASPLPLFEGDSSNRALLSETMVEQVLAGISKHPIPKYFKFSVESHSEGKATTKASYSENRPDVQHEMHTSVASLHFLLDITSYCACISQLHEGEDAMTVDFSTPVLAPVPRASEVNMTATVLRVQGGVIHLEAEAFVQSKLVAKAKIIKSLIAATSPLVRQSKKKEEN